MLSRGVVCAASEAIKMRRKDPVPLTGLDENCLVHHFIRVYGRRPTPRELARLRSPIEDTGPRGRSSPGSNLPAALVVLGLLRRGAARWISRL